MRSMESKQAQTIADRIRELFTRFMYLPDDHYADVLALYVLHTHAFNCFKVTPYIYINSAERGSGKTLLLELLNNLCRNAQMEGGVSPSGLFRIIEAARPTFMVDEVDAVWSGKKNEDLRGVLNSGYKHNGSVLRAFGNPNDEDGGVKRFSTFCPKVLAGIDNGLIPDTIMDRSITITLKRATNEQMKALTEYYEEDFEDEFAEVLSEVEAWATANADRMRDADFRPERIDALGPRQNEISRPLLTVAKAVSADWYRRARIALTALLSADEIALSQQARALLAVRDYMLAHDVDRIPSAKVAELTGENGKQVGVWFNAYGIRPATLSGATMGLEVKNVKAYRWNDMIEAFDRYLPGGSTPESEAQ